MIAYLDTSVILRRVLKEKNPFLQWGQWDEACTSKLTQVEGFRKLDNLQLLGVLKGEAVMQCHIDLRVALEQCDKLPLSEEILMRAGQPFFTNLGTLDTLHLASALIYREQYELDLIFLTHDKQLGRGALAMGLEAKGF